MSWFPRGAILALALAFSSCAKPTREIQPAFVDPSAFMGATCMQLTAERGRRSQALIFAGLAQDQTSLDDRTRLLGVPTPMGTIFEGDNEVAISRLKGELRAIDAQMPIACDADYR
jgi:hypothetical protein